MLIPKAVLFTLTGLIIILPGCIGPLFSLEDPDDPYPPLGMGLRLSESPPVGPFRENPEDLEVFVQFLRQEGHHMMEDCDNPDAFERLEWFIEEERYLRAFDHIFSGCIPGQHVEALAAQARHNGTENQTRDDLLSEAEAAIATIEEKISSHEGPGNALEAHLLSKLSARQVKHTITLEGNTHQRWKAFENGTQRTELQLQAAYMGYYSVIQRSATMEMIIGEYPWTVPVCNSPHVEELTTQIESKIQEAHEKAAKHGHDKVRGVYESHTAYENVQYNRLMNWMVPRFDYMSDHGWWPALLGVEVSIEMHVAYWDSFDDAAWPTQDEAEFMLAQHRNESRTLWHEAHFDGFIEYFSDEEALNLYEWEDDRPAVFLSLLSMRWPFEDLDCPAQSAQG